MNERKWYMLFSIPTYLYIKIIAQVSLMTCFNLNSLVILHNNYFLLSFNKKEILKMMQFRIVNTIKHMYLMLNYIY